MKRRIHIHLGDEARPVGQLHYAQEGAREHAAFEYDPRWLADPERFAIDPALPLVPGIQFRKKAEGGSVFHRAIADTEPDGWAQRVIRRDHAKRRQELRRAGSPLDPAPLNALDYLLAVDDVARVGALRMQDEAGHFQRQPPPGGRGIPPLLELGSLLAATRAFETNRETAADLAYLLGRGTSLGGMRPKCTVLDESGRLAIGKFPSVTDERAVTQGEVLALHLAARAGIDAAEARLVECNGTSVALIQRFDRPAGGGRLPYVSAATLLGADPQDPGEHTYTEIVDALRVHGAEPARDIAQLWRRIAFGILITNVDDHLLNHGFLHHAHGQWRLAPAFDLNPFPDRVRELKTWIAETTGPEASIDALLSVAPYFQISPAQAREILGEVEAAVARWRDVGRELGMTPDELDAFEDAFEHPERTAAQRTHA